MKKIVLWACALVFGTSTLFAQDADIAKKISDLKARQAELTAKATPLNTELEAIKTKLADLEKIGWKYGGTGLLGFTMTGYDNWIVGATPNNSVVSATSIYSPITTWIRYFGSITAISNWVIKKLKGKTTTITPLT
ncbi:MAG: hypothetical protein IPL35_12295 [Sphingobacteriales bacterium]|nr:hypothetical protein [Sphingobacteriales bacterium]